MGTRKQKVYEVLAETVLGRTHEDRLSTAKSMVIKNTKHVGKYRSMINRPIVVEFLHKDDVDYVVSNRRYLPEGVYAYHEYTKELLDVYQNIKGNVD